MASAGEVLVAAEPANQVTVDVSHLDQPAAWIAAELACRALLDDADGARTYSMFLDSYDSTADRAWLKKIARHSLGDTTFAELSEYLAIRGSHDTAPVLPPVAAVPEALPPGASLSVLRDGSLRSEESSGIR